MTKPPIVGRVHAVQISGGGVPKTPVTRARVGPEGLEGDAQRDRRFHGGPERAVCLLGLDVIARLRNEGHPIAPGTTGENLTLAGLDWQAVRPGDRFLFEDGLELEVLSFARPCPTIRASFRDEDFQRLSAERHAGDARVYARVLRAGSVRRGERVSLRPRADEA